jgi:hypothetical protein
MGDLNYHQRSGRMGPLAVPLLLIAALGTGLLLGVPYGYADHYCPLLYFSFIITIVYGTAVGLAVNYAGIAGKVRNVPVLLFAATLAAAIADYVGWVGYIHAVSTDGAWAWSPDELLSWIQQIAEKGLWSIHGSTPTGIALYGIWAAEFGIIAAMAIYIVRTEVGTLPFNERTGTWAKTKATYGPFAPGLPQADLVSRLEHGDTALVSGLVSASSADAAYHEYVVRSCPEDEDFATLSVTLVTKTTGKNGKVETKKRALIKHLLIGPTLRKAFVERDQRRPAPAAPPVAPTPA